MMISNQSISREIRIFGLVAFIVFGSLCSMGIWLKHPLPGYLFGFLSAAGICFIAAPLQMKPVYVLWKKIGNFLARVLTRLILVLTYYLVITPAALIKRLTSGSPLPAAPDKNLESYWVAHQKLTENVKERYLRRF
jgi:hypothetical protein